jgi:hypothetical protein
MQSILKEISNTNIIVNNMKIVDYDIHPLTYEMVAKCTLLALFKVSKNTITYYANKLVINKKNYLKLTITDIIGLLSDYTLKQCLNRIPELMRYINNQSEELQLYFLDDVVYNLRLSCYIIYLKNPSLDIQLKIIRRNFRDIQYIVNPSVETQLTAIKINPLAFKFIHCPSEEIQLEAVKILPKLIENILYPTKSFIEKLFKLDFDEDTIKYLQHEIWRKTHDQ